MSGPAAAQHGVARLEVAQSHLGRHDRDALRAQSKNLLASDFAGRADAAAGAEDAMPGQAAALAQSGGDETRRAGLPRRARHLPVGGHPPARNAGDDLPKSGLGLSLGLGRAAAWVLRGVFGGALGGGGRRCVIAATMAGGAPTSGTVHSRGNWSHPSATLEERLANMETSVRLERTDKVGKARPGKRNLVVAALLAPALAALLAGCGKGSDSHAAAPAGPRALPVAVVPLAPVSVPQSTQYAATLKSRRSAVINSQVTGYIQRIAVRSGDRVRAGQLLMVVDPLKQQATVGSQVSARDAQAATVAFDLQQLRREEALYEDKVASRQDLDQARSTYENAKAQLDSLNAQVKAQQVQLQYYRIVAPLTGIVGDIPVHLGDYVTDTTQLTTVDQPGNLEVYIYVPVERAADLRLGLPVALFNGAGQVVARSSLSFISPQVDNATQTILTKAVVSDDHGLLRTLQYVTARITWGAQTHIVIPVLSAVRLNGAFFAYIAQPKDGGYVAAEEPIQVGPIVGNSYVVESGLNPGDKLIVSGTQFLVNGMPVMPMSAPPGGPPKPGGSPGASRRG